MLEDKYKLKHIEGIRGLAAIIVVFHHYTLAFYPALNFGDSNQTHFGNGNLELLFAKTPLNLIYNGGFAVCIFFILSGYVLSNSYHKTQNPIILTNYSIKRYFRLFIPVSVTIILAYIFIKMGFMNNNELGKITKSGDWLEGSFNQVGGLFDVIKNMFIDVFFFKDNKYNPVLWTMTYELLGSLLLFSFLLITHPLKHKTKLYVALIIILFITQNNFYAAFILGALLNKYILQKQLIAISIPKWGLAALFAIGIFFCSYPICNNVNTTMYRFITLPFLINYEFYHVIGSFMVMFVILHSVKLKSLLSSNVFSFIGKISFSFYLLHFIILCSFSCYLFKIFYTLYNYNTSVLLAFLCSLPVMMLASILFYKWIDRAGIKFSEKVLSVFVSKNEEI
jgi:peptidoglycan/LPS O-acetylase OafA/YrhL